MSGLGRAAPVHDGEVHAPPSGLRVVGGSGGTRAHLEDLDLAAVALDRAAVALEEAAAHVRVLAGVVDEAAPWSAATAPWARSGLAPLHSRWQGVAARADRARLTASSLRTAAEAYAEADRGAEGILRAGLVQGGWLLGEAGPLAWVAAGAGAVIGGAAVAGQVVLLRALRYTPGPLGFLLRAFGSERVQQTPGPVGGLSRLIGTGPGLIPGSLGLPDGTLLETFAPGVAGFVVGAMPGRTPVGRDPVASAAAMLRGSTRLGTVLLGTPTRGLVVAPLVVAAAHGPHSAARRPPPPRDAADLLTQVDALYPGAQPGTGGSAGTVGIQRLDHPDGSRSWVVAIPGTQEWSASPGPNPMDLDTNLAVTAGAPDDVSELVTQAMTRAGIEPGEPVVLAGHSQGGMVAMRIAEDPVLQERFSVTTVLTAGSPVGGAPEGDLAPGVQALHLEHDSDQVWASDGAANPDDPQRTTVRADLSRSRYVENRVAGQGLLGAHDVMTYARTAREVATLEHPSVAAFESALQAAVGPPGTTATTQHYVGVRVP